uniref:CLLAC-motif containing domain-containing protein n=1 Tax=Loxodonta africana TaxID=9785 RepID=G3UNL6_LOXAF
MNGEQWQRSVDTENNEAELLPINPYSSEESTRCGCRLHTVTLQPQWVTATAWSLWKIFLVCLLACLIAMTLVVLVLYFVHFGKLTNNTTVIVHIDGKSSHVTCISGSIPSPTSWSLPGFQPTPVANQSSSTQMPPPAMETTKPT